jgi:hypothetical protein
MKPMKNIKVTNYKNIRVLTTQQLAEEYGTETTIISNNFNRNRERYVAKKHFICLTGDELREFKANHQNDDTLKYTSILYLWTDKGAFLHAKSLNTDVAWAVYERLVDSYFIKQDTNTIVPLNPVIASSVADLGRVTERVMKNQGSAPYKIAEAFKLECEQFGIRLPDDFVKIPEHVQLELTLM